MPETFIDRDRLKNVIRRGLAYSYTSKSCMDGIQTGNAYQSVLLDEDLVKGFRSQRDDIFNVIDFNGRTVLDIGSNLGELCRHALRGGAAHVTGVEYDPLFSLLAELITLHSGIPEDRYSLINADVTKEFKFDQHYDIILAFSVFTYISHRLADIAASVKRTMLIETHVVSDNLDRGYVNPLKEHFPTLIVLGTTDWGLDRKFADGKRVLLACTKSRDAMWEIFNRTQADRLNFGATHAIDLRRSTIPALTQLMRFLAANSLDVVDALPSETAVHEHFRLPPPSNLSSPAYWLEFYRGYKQWARARHVIPHDPYVKTLSGMVASDVQFDPGAAAQMSTPAELVARVTRRYENFANIASQGNGAGQVPTTLLLAIDGEDSRIRLAVAGEESVIPGSRLDGYHRLASAILSGVNTMPVTVFRVIGAV